MLFTLSLAEKLGGRGLLSYSLHPGVISTNLGGHIDWNEGFPGVRECCTDITLVASS